MTALERDLVHLARMALAGRSQDIQTLLQRMARRYGRDNESLGQALQDLLRDAPSADSPLRGLGNSAPVPLDLDSRVPLIRPDQLEPSAFPVLTHTVRDTIDQICEEHLGRDRLLKAGLVPSRSALFVGPPGVGKTLVARWMANRLGLPLLVLDLSSVMSSYLGRTGGNIRKVLDYAKASPSVLLLDELDTVAKRRDDGAEVGELKRLVTVLLQEIDDWPSSSLLLAATNHGELLDPAVWRRFEAVIDFPLPTAEQLREALEQYCEREAKDDVLTVIARALSLQNASFSEAQRVVTNARRRAALDESPLEEVLLSTCSEQLRQLPFAERVRVAVDLVQSDHMSQRRVHELTGVSRDTIRGRMRRQEPQE
ncbi:AAA family ATPase [Streptomyces sp. NPDC056004]|uniref:AAA family ATPase n=1 Tax=Streptomyces sp. NPDC056004 TaxID=3345677 RepID=UPI0035D59B32